MSDLTDEELLALARENERTLQTISAGTCIVCDLIDAEEELQFMG